MEAALMHLGYEVARGHWKNPHTNYLYGQYVSGDIDELVYFAKHSGFSAFSDGPWFSPKLYERLSEEFPQAKFILCVRNKNQWFASLKDMILIQHNSTVTDISPMYQSKSYGFYRWFVKELGEDLDDKDRIVDVYDQHNQDVVDFFEGDGRLLTMTTENLNWKDLCKFLGKKKPRIPFPRQNVRRGI